MSGAGASGVNAHADLPDHDDGGVEDIIDGEGGGDGEQASGDAADGNDEDGAADDDGGADHGGGEDGAVSDEKFDPATAPEWVQLLTTRSPLLSRSASGGGGSGAADSKAVTCSVLSDEEEATVLEALTPLSALSPSAVRVREYIVGNGGLTLLLAILAHRIPPSEPAGGGGGGTAAGDAGLNTAISKLTISSTTPAAIIAVATTDAKATPPSAAAAATAAGCGKTTTNISAKRSLERVCKAMNAIGSLAMVESIAEQLITTTTTTTKNHHHNNNNNSTIVIIDSLLYLLHPDRASPFAQLDGCFAVGWFIPVPGFLPRFIAGDGLLRLLSIVHTVLLPTLAVKQRVPEHVENLRTFALVALQKCCIVQTAHEPLIAITMKQMTTASTATTAPATATATDSKSNTHTSSNRNSNSNDTTTSDHSDDNDNDDSNSAIAVLTVLTEIVATANHQSFTLLVLALHGLHGLFGTVIPTVSRALQSAPIVYTRLSALLTALIASNSATTSTTTTAAAAAGTGSGSIDIVSSAPSADPATHTTTGEADDDRAARSNQLVTLSRLILDSIKPPTPLLPVAATSAASVSAKPKNK